MTSTTTTTTTTRRFAAAFLLVVLVVAGLVSLSGACDPTTAGEAAGDGTEDPGHHRSHHPHSDHDHDEHGTGGIDHHNHPHDNHQGCNHQHKPPPRHPGETEYAILRIDPEAEVPTFPIFNYTTTGAGDASSTTTRSMKFAGPGGKPLRQCGVPDPSRRETIMTLKVLDAWEAQDPGRRQRLLNEMQHSRRMFQMQLDNNSTNTNETATGNATNVTIVDANGTIVSNATNTTKNGTGTITKNLVVKVWFHVMRAGDTPQLGMWTNAQARRSVKLANLYFAHSPVLFQLAGVTQTVNNDWFQCKFDKDYATELQYKTFLRREGADTLNVYMCDLLRGQGLWGYASFPSALRDWPEYDGIVLANPFTKQDGSTAMDAHMTFIHEVGHWMGVYHTWTGTCDRASGGDSVSDTAAHVRDTWFYPGYENCFEGRKYNTCPDNVKGVDPGFDPLLNHMNYVYTQCQFQKGHFTDGQMITMVSKFETYRHKKTTCRKRGVPCRTNVHCCSRACNVATKLCS